MKTSVVLNNEAQIVKNVYVSHDYNFNTIDGNRNINQLHVQRLKRSMSEKQLISPIIVNENNEIIDGQHRVVALRELGLPVYYIVCPGYSLPEVQRLNREFRAWNVDDFLDGYINFGKESYIEVKKFKERHGWSSTKLVITLLNRNQREDDVVSDFKRGNYNIEDLDWATEFVCAIEVFQKYFPEYKTSYFVKAFRLLYECPGYNHKTMEKKLKYQSGKIERQNSIEQYALMLTEIYNFRQPSRKRIYYLDGRVA